MRTMPVDEVEIVYRAIRAYGRRFPGAMWPGQESELDDRDFVTLRNCRGVLATYKYDRKSDKLTYIKE